MLDITAESVIRNTAVNSPRQRSLKRSITCKGIGLHSGSKVTMTLRPADADTGIVFRRIDVAGSGALIPATWDKVSDTRLNTCISNGQGVHVRTIEHLMAAFAGAGIDNVIVDINGPEVPAMDGSAAPFIFLIECAGIAEQDVNRRLLRVLEPVSVQFEDRLASLEPAEGFSLRFEIDFPSPAVARQECHVRLDEGIFQRDIARARTFGFDHEVAQLRAAGLAKGGSLDNAVVISDDRILNEDGLRYPDEFVRHKILDAVGDLYLAGAPIVGAFHGVRSGHALNNKLLHELFSRPQAWEMVDAATGAATARPAAPRLASTA